MSSVFYSIEKLAEIKETNAKKAIKNFKNRKDYFNTLNGFAEETRKFLLSYNPMVVVYSPDELRDFEEGLDKIISMLKQLQMDFLDADLKTLRVAANSGSPKSMQDELRKLLAMTDIFAERIAEAQIDTEEEEIEEEIEAGKAGTIVYDIDRLYKITEFDAKSAMGAYKNKQAYFDALTEFSVNAYKSLCAYNPTVVIFADEIKREFFSRLDELKKFIEDLKIKSVDYELNRILGAIKKQDVKELSDELLKFNAKVEIIARSIVSAVSEEGQGDTDESLDGVRVIYDMKQLERLEEFDAKKAMKKFKSKKEFFNKLTELVDKTKKITQSYNPMVIVYGEEARSDFLEEMQNIKTILALLDIHLVTTEIANIERAVQKKNTKHLSDELTKFNAKIRILSIRISSAGEGNNELKSKPINPVYSQKAAKARTEFYKEMDEFISHAHKFLISYIPSRAECDNEYRKTFIDKAKEVKRIMGEIEKSFKLD